MVIPIVISVSILERVADQLSDYYILMPIFLGGSSANRTDRIGYNRDETITRLVHEADIDDTELQSLHLADDTTAYQNTSGKTAYAMITVRAITDAGERNFKIYSAPTTNSKAAATEVYNSDDWLVTTGWDATGEKVTTHLLPIQNNHFIVLENTSGASPRNIEVDDTETLEAFVIEQAP